MKECANECVAANKNCNKKECRLWMDCDEDLNCSLVSIEKNGAMTLHQVGDKLNLSFVRIKQIQDLALDKIDKDKLRDEFFVLDDGFF